MMKRSFLVGDRPTLVSMVQGNHPDRIRELMRLSLADGAEAFGMQFCKLPAEVRTPDVVISVTPGHSDLVETRIIDGFRYIMIRADHDVQVNGVYIQI